MKKIIMIATIGLLFTSCKKSYTCVCQVTKRTTSNGSLIKSEASEERTNLGKQKKSDAQIACSNKDGQTSSGTVGDGVVVDKICSLKQQ